MMSVSYCRLVRALLCVLGVLASAAPTIASPGDAMDSVVSVLPVWPGRAQGGVGAEPGTAPEGSGIVIRPGIVATAWHVVAPAQRIDVRLSDGRILPARLLQKDTATDIALLEVQTDAPVIATAHPGDLASPACAIGNAYGLGLSISCGVISAVGVTNAGFNAVEHFVQTDAAANPGTSGGALVDADGRLIGMVSAIFASQGDTNIGINFAVSTALLDRVADALIAEGTVVYPAPGWQLAMPDRAQLALNVAPIVRSLVPNGAAQSAGVLTGDLIIQIEDMAISSPRDAIAALALIPRGQSAASIILDRDGERMTLSLPLSPKTTQSEPVAPAPLGDCPHPEPACLMRQAVFPISSFDPVASATRIGADLLVTNRHVIGDREDAIVHTPDGPRGARVVPSAYGGDLVLLQVDGLPEAGFVPEVETVTETWPETFFAVGADVARQEVRVFEPGQLIANPAPDAQLARLHVTARMQPGVSGGAVVGPDGQLIAIAVGGGDGRFEAIPLRDVVRLQALAGDARAQEIHARSAAAFVSCKAQMDQATQDQAAADVLVAVCTEAANHGQLLEAGRIMAQLGEIDAAASLHGLAATQVPNSINARLSLLVSLQLGARFEEMLPHAEQVMTLAPEDPQALRFAIQSGVWGNAPDLAERAYELLQVADPRQAAAARRFIDNAPPAPQRR